MMQIKFDRVICYASDESKPDYCSSSSSGTSSRDRITANSILLEMNRRAKIPTASGRGGAGALGLCIVLTVLAADETLFLTANSAPVRSQGNGRR